MRIAVVGLGYVGLPLLFELSKSYKSFGVDISKKRVSELLENYDSTGELDVTDLRSLNCPLYSDFDELADVYIVTVPTPVDDSKKPDLSPLISVCHSLSRILKKGDLVVFESTVYPGCTEEECVPLLEKGGLVYGRDFGVGYSPERINPGDKVNTVKNVKKIISASSEYYLNILSDIYGSFLGEENLFFAKDIRHAEMSKVFENTQRDVNIALVNELSLICQALDLETSKVLEACRSKWNFLDFRPGLVGGHCIGVDPYYLIHRAQKENVFPELITASRKVNELMVESIVGRVCSDIVERKITNPIVSVLGMTFKENCPDIRNSKAIDLIRELKKKGLDIMVHDPYVVEPFIDGVTNKEVIDCLSADIIIISVAHKEYIQLFDGVVLEQIPDRTIVYDLKSVLPENMAFAVRSL